MFSWVRVTRGKEYPPTEGDFWPLGRTFREWCRDFYEGGTNRWHVRRGFRDRWGEAWGGGGQARTVGKRESWGRGKELSMVGEWEGAARKVLGAWEKRAEQEGNGRFFRRKGGHFWEGESKLRKTFLREWAEDLE